ncbi:MAG: diguanylate cyclase [Acidobacteriia bacterium]|nr:diguanylate cyclase [Terriglobia bacterium]
MKILAAEDNPISQSVLRSMLTKWGYEVIATGDGNEAWHILQSKDAPRIAILDWMMPGRDGVELCRNLRASGIEPYTYILLVTARTDSKDLVEAMDAGADDYLKKPFSALELRARLRAGQRIIELQEQLLIAREALRMRATHDGLTGLLNRSAIMETLRAELERSAREPKALSILMLDLDRFKQINDTYGHLAGDAILREASARMKATVRSYDSVGRYGGEEFLLVLPGCNSVGALALSERIRQCIAATRVPIGEQEITVTCSIGCASQSAEIPCDADSLLRLADRALYDAKNNGRNRVEPAGAVLLNL